jgi:hypothetical protein
VRVGYREYRTVSQLPLDKKGNVGKHSRHPVIVKIHSSTLLRNFGLNALMWLSLLLALSSTGCRSFLASQGMKNYPVKAKPMDALASPNRYQQDFLYLETLAEEVFPLENRYFPPDQRAAMEKDILQQLGQPGCSYETFLFDVRSYLAAFNNMHAAVVFTPRDFHFAGFYPFRIHYVSNEVYVVDIAREYDRALIGQKITAINDHLIPELEQKLSGFRSAENPWTKRKSLEPIGFSQPEYYRLLGLTASASNSLKLEFADHPAIRIDPKWQPDFQWHIGKYPPHPITAPSPHQYDCQIFPEQNFAYLQFNACFDKTAILDGLEMVKPWVRPLVRAWLTIQFHRKKPFAILKGIYDPERPVFIDYLASTIQEINQKGITHLIIDLRRNSGGEGELVKQLVYHLTGRTDLHDFLEFQYNPEVFAHYDPKGNREFRSWYLEKFKAEPPSKQLLPTPEQERPFFYSITDPDCPYYVPPDRPVFSGKIIVLANQNTGSAASLLTGLMQDNSLAVIVGTTTANNPTGPSGMTPFKLPRSGILVSLPTKYLERALPSKGDILQPDYWVESSVADLQTGRDAAFEKALEILNSK